MQTRIQFVTAYFFMLLLSANAQTDVEKLSNSPRHHEWVEVNYNGRTVYCFVAYPEVAYKAKTVIVIHENRGLNDWARVFTDELAGKGYLAIAPDLLSNYDTAIRKTTDFENPDSARDALYKLAPNQITNDLNAVFNYAKTIPSGNGKIAVVGFCWGGSQSFRYAANNPNLEEAFVFYGASPTEEEALKRIKIPVYGFYGGNDNRVNATIEKTAEVMKNSGKKFEYEIYEGAGHAFMRSGAQTDAIEANKNAHDKAWERLLLLLKKQ
jgi:carboxymethylenebutenolidase